MLRIWTILRVENHPDRFAEVVGALSNEADAESSVASMIEADQASASLRGYPNSTDYHYRIEGPFLVTKDGRSIFMQDHHK